MNSSYCLNMSLCNNHKINETNISFYNILLNACAKGTCITGRTYLLPRSPGHVVLLEFTYLWLWRFINNLGFMVVDKIMKLPKIHTLAISFHLTRRTEGSGESILFYPTGVPYYIG